ncbi:tRNA pseudouridine(55) synthase TruB [Lysobacter solisilvae (ex Woo and Kim 2020)]|uniref:tRNA pseudouridine synthase B n=1 Tax=Agrilutibacter terrestris TaxID=2865112 RepID=A0A7H0FWI8_9GAMM|nr:tRNA pseudouridine(55) synthase TruB [Lysobacter terrestris]QNP40404.1 tRNA pseudouridine(55) synthase TruB [Lysobacter terrestris]
MSKKPRTIFRKLDGILLLDKPQGLSSNQALQRVRHLFRAEKAGHTGSLDPLATGLLPVCFGEATKIAGLLLGAHKAYETTAALGLTTDTDDADGAPLLRRDVPGDLGEARIEAALAPLRGRIRQRAPIYSALKQGGEPLYVKARRGEAIEAPEREVEVHQLRVLERQAERIRLLVECGSGTYVRSLVRDMGESLGCGAHVATLRRLWVDPFGEPRMFTLDQLLALAETGGEAALEACLLPIEAGLTGFPRVELDDVQARRLGQGQRLGLDGVEPAACVAIHARGGRVLGLGEVDSDGVLRPTRLFTWTTEAAAAPANP